ncbi:MAG: bifunctional diguanylate cyclase/phosphodiesterase [Gammaproteobacteria bacterium]|nr:bifunctional diguanylate cyclase/phosphodiesterase [Gammaproteobacteria bacterium]
MDTGSRESMFDRLKSLIEQQRDNQAKLALLIINIRHFRQFNITHGYAAGDQLLDEFFARLQQISRDRDHIARIGNADFAMLLPEILNEGHATLAAIKLLGCLDEPFVMNDQNIRLGASIGIAIYPDHAVDAEDLAIKAETALNDAHHEIESYAIYSSEVEAQKVSRWDIESDLQQAIDQNQFDLYFQPQIHMDNGELFGAEALIRWQNGERGFIRPDIFIPIAEQSGKIFEITRWTINAALWAMNEWPQQPTPLNAAVNISTRTLSEPGLVETVENALNIYGIDYGRLTLEITESALLEDVSTSVQTLEELKSLGVNISIDDFGTGYSSMAYFKNIPANELKIDQSFVRYMLENQMDQHIVKTVIKMAHGFDLKVVAEGIEDEATFDELQRLGCDIAQGYLLARPMPQETFIQWLEEYQSGASKRAAR